MTGLVWRWDGAKAIEKAAAPKAKVSETQAGNEFAQAKVSQQENKKIKNSDAPG